MTQARGEQEETMKMCGPGLTLTAVAALMFRYGKAKRETTLQHL